MTRNRGFAVAGLLAVALVLVQHLGLERTAERKEEDKYTRIADLPATSVLPSYIASLFLGSFRAIAVDMLWIEMERMRREEHRYFETVEVMKFIALLQPRNPEVWAQQAQDAGWNIANPLKDPERKWTWILVAYDALDTGIRRLPDNPYLKFEMARILHQKPTVSEGDFDAWYLKQVEGDAALQLRLQRLLARLKGESEPEGPVASRSAFDLAREFLERAAEDVERLKERNGFKYWTTHTGYNLSLSTLEGYQRFCQYYQGHYLWRSGKPAEAAAWFRQAEESSHRIAAKHGIAIYTSYAEADRVSAEAAERDAAGADDAEVVGRLAAALPRLMRNDYQYVRAMAGALKQRLGGDAFEWNDDPHYPTGLAQARTAEGILQADLFPAGDVDVFAIQTPVPPEGQEFGLHDAQFSLVNRSSVAIKIEFWNPSLSRQEAPAKIVPPGEEGGIIGSCDRYGIYFLYVTAVEPPRDGAKAEYAIGWTGWR